MSKQKGPAGNKHEDESLEKEDKAGSAADKNDDLDPDTEMLRDLFAASLDLKEKPPSKLEEVTFAGIAKYLASDQCKNVITMAGAGISTSAGIPDFRSPGTGLYDNLAAYKLPHPQAIFELGFFMTNPKPFFVLAKELYPGTFKPTPCHYFIKMLNDKGKLLRHYTQNIDTLERVSGLDVDKIVEAHGTFYTSHCLKCNKEYTLEWMKVQIFADKVPVCKEKDCSGVVKPDIIFFGEALPRRFAKLASEDFVKCDLLIVMGTSLTVQPFASLVNRVSNATPRLYINLEKGTSSDDPLVMLMCGSGFNFDGKNNYRDVFKSATCDDGCLELANLLGWSEELQKVIQTEHCRIDAEKASQNPKSQSKPSKSAAGSDSKSPKVQSSKDGADKKSKSKSAEKKGKM